MRNKFLKFKTKNFRFICLTILFTIFIGIFLSNSNSNNLNQANLNFTIQNLKGKEVKVNQFKGKVIFINFWATWCPPCVEEMPGIVTLKNKFKNNTDVIFLLIEMDGNKDRILEFLNKINYKLPTFIAKSDIPKSLYNGTLPTTVIIDRNGKIAFKTIKKANYKDPKIENLIKNLSKK